MVGLYGSRNQLDGYIMPNVSYTYYIVNVYILMVVGRLPEPTCNGSHKFLDIYLTERLLPEETQPDIVRADDTQ